jgi:predicted DNA-binding transcriptional regulator AlpA
MNSNRYLPQTEAAEFLRVSERSLERWRVEGTGPRFRRFGRRVVYAKADLETWADSRCFQSTSAIGHSDA